MQLASLIFNKALLLSLLLAVAVFAPVWAQQNVDNLAAREQWSQTHFAGQKAFDAGNYSEAETLYRQALTQAEGLGYAGPLGLSLYSLGKLYHAQAKRSEAESYYKRALEIYDEQVRKNSTVHMSLIKDYAKLLRELGREGEAAEQEARIKNPAALQSQ